MYLIFINFEHVPNIYILKRNINQWILDTFLNVKVLASICIVGLCLYFTVNVYLQPAEITHLCLYRACGFQRERM